MTTPARALRTYSHLASERRIPREYEVVSTQLHHHTDTGFEVTTPIVKWYEQHGKRSRLIDVDWERFYDPRETTYAKYTSLQAQKETFVGGVLRYIDDIGYDARLADKWRQTLARVLTPSRYLFHGLQMIIAYIGQMAPSGRVTIACTFQTADEIRRIQCISYRMRQIQDTHPGFGNESRAMWQSDPAWQPLREVVERLLVTYDWDEALAALNLVVKPMIDALILSHLAALAWREGDPLLAEILFSLNQDGQWHRDWSDALFGLITKDHPENQAVMQSFVDRWRSPARKAIEGLAAILPTDPAQFLAEVDQADARRLQMFDLHLPGKEAMS